MSFPRGPCPRKQVFAPGIWRWGGMANHLRCSVSCTSILLDLLGLWPSSILSSSILLSNIWTCLMSKMQSSSLPFRCNTCKKRMPIFAQFIGAQGKHTCFTEALGSVENNLQYLYVDYEWLWYILIQRPLWYLTPYDSRQSHSKTHDTWQRM